MLSKEKIIGIVLIVLAAILVIVGFLIHDQIHNVLFVAIIFIGIGIVAGGVFLLTKEKFM